MAEGRAENAIDVAEQERSRWARQLHDETLQALALLRMRLASALREESPAEVHEAAREAVERIDEEIVRLRRLITELRPASLDAIGLEAALRALCDQQQVASGIEIDCDLDLDGEEARPPAVLRTAVYRLVQEALNDLSQRGIARRVELAVRARPGAIEVELSDDSGADTQLRAEIPFRGGQR